MMNFLILVVGVFVVFGTLVLLPLFVKYLNRKDKRLKFLLLIPVIIFVYSVYTAIYPRDSFYKHDFKEVTGTSFPETGEIIYKIAGFPDQSGDYGSVSIVKVDKEFYDSLDKQLIINGLTKTTERIGSSELDKALKEINGNEIEKEFALEKENRVYYYVAFLSDKETVVVHRHSW